MVNYYLLDTGFKSSAASGTKESSIVNTGLAMVVDIRDITLASKANIEASALSSGTSPSDANYISTENRVYNITLAFQKDIVSEQQILQHILGKPNTALYPGLDRTRGLKILYANGTSATKPNLIELHGTTNSNFHGSGKPLNAAFPAIIGHITNLSCRDVADSGMFTVSFQLIETKL